jgi:predicted AAA+ superfamily ATPase
MDGIEACELIERGMEPTLRRAAEQYPVVTVMGPRQSGKTTLVRACFPDHGYCNLEDPENRSLAQADPKGFIRRNGAPVILDEVQRVPGLLSLIQVEVDARPRAKGAFILSGSHQPQLKADIGQSLAGRTAILKLLPLSMQEANRHGVRQTRDEWLLRGCLPRLYLEEMSPTGLYRNYYETYVERDVRQLIQLKQQPPFELFLKLLAGRVGQVLNLHGMSGDIGVSTPTLREWLSVLEASFIVFRLLPYYENFGKRYIKSPKLYFTEPGLAAYLLEIRSPEQAARDPLMGNLFENLVVVEALKARWNAGLDADLYYFRDQSGFEIDLILSRQRRLYPFEIKASQTYNPDFFRNLKKFSQWREDIHAGTVIYAGEVGQKVQGGGLVSFGDTARHFEELAEPV